MCGEKRRSDRINVSLPIIIRTDSAKNGSWLAFVQDNSAHGMLLWSAHPLPVNVPLMVHFPRELGKAVAIARIVRNDGCLFGCEFIHRPQIQVSALRPPVFGGAGTMAVDEATTAPLV